MLQNALRYQIKFRYVLMDSWFASKENFEYIFKKNKHFIAAIKANRLFALNLKEKYDGHFRKINDLGLKDNQLIKGYLKGFDKEVFLVCRVFTNKDGSISRLYLVPSDTSLSSDHIITIYQKRWKVEECHKSLKSDAAIAKSPTKTIATQISHIVMSMIAVFKLECLEIKHSLNHFALKTKKYSSKQNGCNGVN